MERNGVYRKGRQGHVRNVNAYRMYMQHFKKWRMPLTVVLGLTLVFGIAPTVGNEFQASVLSTEQYDAISQMQPDEAKKRLFESLHSFVADCERLKIDACVSDGKKLEGFFGSAPLQPKEWVAHIQGFVETHEKKVALASCHSDLANDGVKIALVANDIESFASDYEGLMDTTRLTRVRDSLAQAQGMLNSFVQECKTR